MRRGLGFARGVQCRIERDVYAVAVGVYRQDFIAVENGVGGSAGFFASAGISQIVPGLPFLPSRIASGIRPVDASFRTRAALMRHLVAVWVTVRYSTVRDVVVVMPTFYRHGCDYATD